MAEDPQLASRPPAATTVSIDNKRKYEDTNSNSTNGGTPPAPARRSTGFSAPIASPSPDSNVHPPPLYNSAPSPADADFQLAKQRAQEIAARIFNNAEAKRPRVENGGAVDSSDLSQKSQGQQISNTQSGLTSASLPVPYGFQGSSKKIDIPNGRVGVIIGKGGETIKYLQLQSGAKIQVTRDMDADPNSLTRMVELIGSPEQISKAEQLINDVIAEAEAGGSGIVAARRLNSLPSGAEQFTMKVPNNKVGLIIGKNGETIKNMQARSGARIQLIPLHPPPGDTSTERTLQIDGSKEQIESAKQLVNEVISEGEDELQLTYLEQFTFILNRVRNPQMGVGYSQQGYRPPRPPTSWGPPGPPPMQQPGYGYMQPGAFPGPPPQYNMSQQPYTGYPPQPTSGGYSSGWDQTPAPANQQSAPSGGYDYYSQQPQQHQPVPGGSSAPADNTSYNYGQPPVSNYNPQGPYSGDANYSQPSTGQPQGYGQDGYGNGYNAPGPQSGYSQPPPNPHPGYDQGYNSASSYGTMGNPSQDGAPSSYGAQTVPGPAQPPAAVVPAPVQSPAATQQGYTGNQPTTTPSYTAQGNTQTGYGMPQATQPGYGSQPPMQSGYGQTPPLAQPGYGQPQGQKPPPTQAPYGQAQAAAPTSQGSYIQPVPGQTGYSHSQPLPAQPGYVQQDSTRHRGPPSGFGPAVPQPGYGQQQPYGAPPPVAQSSYGQQPQQPYSDSYTGGYPQTSAYSADNTGAGNRHGSYEAPPSAQPAVQSGVAKASPQS